MLGFNFMICFFGSQHVPTFVYLKNIYIFNTDLKYSRTFARSNGFGPVPQPPAYDGNESVNIKMFRELHGLLKSFTGAEEAAIRQISPLISIVRFPHGSLGSKGNTTCVW